MKKGLNVIIEEGAVIGKDAVIDHNVIIRKNVVIGDHVSIGANCIIGERTDDSIQNTERLHIGDHALIRSGSILYEGSQMGNHFQTGHQVTIREKSIIGDSVSIGTLSDIQGDCTIGNHVRLHSNVHVGKLTRIDDFVWIYPYVVFTNDPTPPSDLFAGVHVHEYAVIATAAVLMPGVEICEEALVAAGAVVTKRVEPYQVVGGNPAKVMGDTRNIKNRFTGEPAYPWKYHLDRHMPWEGIGYEEWKRKQES